MKDISQLDKEVAVSFNYLFVIVSNEIFSVNASSLDRALRRVQKAIENENIDNVFEIAACIAFSVANAHAFAHGNKRTALMLALDYLKGQGIEITHEDENTILGYAIRDMVLGGITRVTFAQILYEQSLKS